MLSRILCSTMALCIAVPASASDAVQVPEASGALLFALGVLGVIVGRRLSMSRRDED